jgi:MFS family permease
VIFVASETWINQLAKPESRATLLAVYATVLSAGFGSGGLLLAALGSEGWTPWLVGAAVYGLGALPIILLRGPGIAPPDRSESGLTALWSAARLAPAAMLAGLVFGALETSTFALLPVYAERLGFDATGIGILAAIGALGALCLQIPIGRFADTVGRPLTLRLVAAAAVVLALLIAVAGARLWALAPMVFLFVGAASAFYTIGLALIGERVKPGALAAANAAFIFAYGVGSLIGPPLGGAAMDAADPWGLVIALAGFALLYLIGARSEKARLRH